MICSELIGTPNRAMVDLGRYDRLNPDGKRLISGWFNRGWAKRDCQPSESFEPFIFTWISFNGWAACVTDVDRDWSWQLALMQDQRICEDFVRLVRDHNQPISDHAHAFHQMWPIFKAQSIRRKRISPSIADDRQEVIQYYLSENVRDFEPKCWVRHLDDGTPAPLDWPHTLAALYRVRCNLFHGDKSPHSEMNRNIVAAAFRVLVHFTYGYIWSSALMGK